MVQYTQEVELLGQVHSLALMELVQEVQQWSAENLNSSSNPISVMLTELTATLEDSLDSRIAITTTNTNLYRATDYRYEENLK